MTYTPEQLLDSAIPVPDPASGTVITSVQMDSIRDYTEYTCLNGTHKTLEPQRYKFTVEYETDGSHKNQDCKFVMMKVYRDENPEYFI